MLWLEFEPMAAGWWAQSYGGRPTTVSYQSNNVHDLGN